MAELSKTARAAMKAGAGTSEVKVIPDAQLVKQLREDREDHIWPALPKVDALLREHDAWNEHYQEVTLEASKVRQALDIHGKGIETVDAINELKRQLALAESKNETYQKALDEVRAGL